MAVLLGGDGSFTFGLSRGRLYEEALAAVGEEACVGEQRVPCLVMLLLDDGDPYDLHNSVAAAVFRRGGRSIAAGYFTKTKARRFRTEIEKLGVNTDEPIMCLGLVLGNEPFGKFAMPYRLLIDLTWPLTPLPGWYDIAHPFMAEAS